MSCCEQHDLLPDQGRNECAAVREQYPDLPIIWGGYHPSTQPDQTLQNPFIDIVVRGQGELTFKDIVHRIHENQPLDGVAGISYKQDGHIITNPDQEFTDLNQFSPIPYDMIDVESHVKDYISFSRYLQSYSE